MGNTFNLPLIFGEEKTTSNLCEEKATSDFKNEKTASDSGDKKG